MSIFKQLAGASMENLAPSEETIAAQVATAQAAEEREIITISDEIDSDIEVIGAIGNDIDKSAEEVSKASVASGAIENLVDQTIDTYGADGITEQGAAVLQASMESVLKAAGINIPVGVVVPSFENGISRTDYSTEAEEKKEGIIKRILKWLADAYTAVIDSVGNFFGRFFVTAGRVKKYVEKVKAKVGSQKGDGNAAEISLGGEAIFIDGGNPSASLNKNVEVFQKFVTRWAGTFGAVADVKVGTIDGTFQAASMAIRGMKENGVTHLKGLDIVPGYSVEVAPGANAAFPMIGAKLKVNAGEKPKDKKVRGVSLSDCKSGIEVCEKALKVLDGMKTKVDEWSSDAKKLQSWAKKIAFEQNVISKVHDNVHVKNNAAEIRDTLKSIVGASQVMAQGWSQAAPLFLRSVKIHATWVDRSCRGSVGQGSDDLKTVKPDDVKAIGYDKDGKKSSGAYGNGKEPEKEGTTYQKKK
jgi:hypothetical protein